MTMTETLSLAEVKAHLSELVRRVSSQHDRVTVTVHGRPSAVLLSPDDLDALEETIAVLSDAELLAAHREGRAAIDADDYLGAHQLAHAMREAGRLPL